MDKNTLEHLLTNNFDENDPNIQQMYYTYMNKIIDSVLLLKYNEDKKKKIVSTTDQIYSYIISYFKKINFLNQDEILSKLAHNISYMTKEKSNIAYYINKLEALFEIYATKGSAASWDEKFYNEILNKQQNAYISKKREEIIEKLIGTLPLSTKKNKAIYNAIRLQVMSKRKFLQELELSKEELDTILSTAHFNLTNKKNLQKEYELNEEDYRYLDFLFLSNQLKDEIIIEKFPSYNKRQVKQIKNAYVKGLLPHLPSVKMEGAGSYLEYILKNLRFNYSHLKFYNALQEQENIKVFLNELESDEINKIDIEDINILKQLLPLINILEEYDTQIYKSIFVHFPKIKQRLKQDFMTSKKFTIHEILNNFHSVLELATVYKVAENKNILSILGEDIIKKIIETKFISYNPEDYFNVYLEMLKNYKSSIPSISGEFRDYVYESGTSKVERLLIGKNVIGSCIGPKGSGEEAYHEALCEENADVLMIKKKDTDEFVGRSLLFRRGNFIIFAPIYDAMGIKDELYNLEFLKAISNQIMEQAKEKNDNIDYIFISEHDDLKGLFPYYEDSIFRNCVPHCDIEDKVFLLNKETLIQHPLQPLAQPKGSYLKSREEIKQKTNDYLNDIKRIECLTMIKESSSSIKNQEPEEIDEYTYDEVYVGQDWYIGIKNNEIIKTMMYKISDPRQEIEINNIIQRIMEERHLQR